MKHRTRLFLSGFLAAIVVGQTAMPALAQNLPAESSETDDSVILNVDFEDSNYNPVTGFNRIEEKGTDNHVLHSTGCGFPLAWVNPGAPWTDYAVQFDFKINEKLDEARPNDWDIGQFDGIGCYFRTDTTQANAYNVFLRVNEHKEGSDKPGAPHPAGTYELGTFISANNVVRAQAVQGEDFEPVEMQKWYTQKIVVKDYTIEVYVGEKGGELQKIDKLTYEDTEKLFTYGGIRLDTQGVDAYFDNLSVTNMVEFGDHFSNDFEGEAPLDGFRDVIGDWAQNTENQISEVVDSGEEAYGKVWKLSGNEKAYAKYYPAMFDDFAVSFDMKSENNGNPALCLRSAAIGNSGYRVEFGKDSITVTKPSQDGKSDLAVASAALSKERTEGFHHYEVMMVDNVIAVFMDGEEILCEYDFDTSSPIEKGGITFQGWQDTVYLDNIESRKIDVSEMPAPEPVPFEMNRDEVRLSVGDSTTVSPLYDKIAAKKAGTSYVSNDESVAVVDEYGVITAKAPGEAMITATAWDGAQASVRVLVNEPCKTFYYVALNGSDETGDGSIEHPFATVEKARDTIRALDTLPEGGVTVYLRDGEYYIDETITFTPEDSGEAGKPIVYASYPGEEALIHSGKKITGFTKLTENYPAGLPEIAKGNVYVADVEKGWRFHDLYVNGERQQVARQFNSSDWDTWQTFTELPESPLVTKDSKGMKVKFQPRNLDDLPSNGDVELYLLPVVWWNSLPVVTNIDAENNTAYLESFNPAIEPSIVLQYNGKYNLMNAPKFLDLPGEWCVDSENGKVYWWPENPEDLEKEIIAPELYELVRMQGDEEEDNWENQVEYLELRNLSFAYTDRLPENQWSDSKENPDLLVRNAENPDAAIFMQGVENCAVIDSRVTNTGAYAIALDHYAKYNRIVHNKLGNLGCGGVQLYGYGPGSGKTLNINTKNVVLANHMHDLGLAPYQHSSAITIYGASYTDGKFNLIERVPYTAIMITGADADSMNPAHFNSRAYVDTYGNLTQYGLREEELKSLGSEITDKFNTGADNGRAAMPYQSSDYNIMEYNIARDYMLHMNDGGCYYAWSMGKNNEYNYNIAEKKEKAKQWAQSLYMDDYANFVRLEGNRVWAVQTAPIDKGRGTNVWRDNQYSSDMSAPPQGFMELQAAILGTVAKMGGYTGILDEQKELEDAITRAEEMVKDAEQYVSTSWQELLDALEAAKMVRDDESAGNQDRKDAAWNLEKAMEAQRHKADKSALEELIQKADGVYLPIYTTESVKVFTDALEEAKRLMQDDSLSVDDQASVDSAAAKLKEAMDNLQKRTDGGEEPSEPTNPGGDTPATGEELPTLMIAVAFGSLLMAAMCRIKKKKNS